MTDVARDAAPGGSGLGVGKALADARRAQGLAIADVAQQLKFMPRQLDALEHERFSSLPGPTIARGMVRTYARFLKIDPEPLIAAMAGHVEVPDASPQLAARYSQPVPFSDSGRRSTLLYLTLSAFVLAVAGAAVYEWRTDRDLPQFIDAAKAPPAVPVSAQTASSAPVSIAAAPQAEPQPAPSQPASSEPPPKPEVKVEAKPQAKAELKPQAKAESRAEGKAERKVEPPAAPQAAAAMPESPAKSLGTHRIVFRFEEEAWIEVTDGAGRLLASSLNPAGSERVLHGRPPFNLVIGNASNVRLRYNDRDIDLQPHVKVEVARFTLK